MKANRFTNLIIAAFGLAAFSTAGCAEKEKISEAPLPPAKDVAKTTTTTAVPEPATTVKVAITASPEVASANWTDIKNCTYDMRGQFFAGLKLLKAKVDDQINELTAKRATMKGATETQDWDFAMKEMVDARSALKSIAEDLSKATPETWDQGKDKVGQAWVRTQDAYGKVKSSTTS